MEVLRSEKAAEQSRTSAAFSSKWVPMENQVPSRAVSSGIEATMTQKHNHFGDKSRVDLKRMQGNVQEQAISSKEALVQYWKSYRKR
uniref:Uncharacterized protein n=1 Tax=Ditylenchus dipsaci TaxID=166011 RepID=A0A915CQS7_9BILA